MSAKRGLNSAGRRPMQVILQASKTEETEAARELAQLVDAEAAARAQLEQLLQFLDQYSVGAGIGTARGAAPEPSLHPSLLGNRHAFVDRLMEALKIQHRRCTSIEQDVARQRASWLSLQARRRAVERLMERERAVQLEVAERREQAALDFSATRGARSAGMERAGSFARPGAFTEAPPAAQPVQAQESPEGFPQGFPRKDFH